MVGHFLLVASFALLAGCSSPRLVADRTDRPSPIHRDNPGKPPPVIEGIARDNASSGQRVFRPQECEGPIENGVCKGRILPQAGPHPVCRGQMIGGVCSPL